MARNESGPYRFARVVRTDAGIGASAAAPASMLACGLLKRPDGALGFRSEVP